MRGRLKSLMLVTQRAVVVVESGPAALGEERERVVEAAPNTVNELRPWRTVRTPPRLIILRAAELFEVVITVEYLN